MSKTPYFVNAAVIGLRPTVGQRRRNSISMWLFLSCNDVGRPWGQVWGSWVPASCWMMDSISSTVRWSPARTALWQAIVAVRAVSNADDAFGISPSFRDGLAALGMRYVLDVPGGTTVWPLEPAWTSPEYQGFGRPRKPKLRDGQRRTMEQRSDELPDEAWREITVAQGSQGPRGYQFSVQRVRPTAKRRPGEIHWAIWRRNLDGSELRYYLSNAPEDTPLETLARVGGSRWRIETEFETEKSDVGLDEYETRTPYPVRGRLWAGWHHHIALCLLAGAFLLSLQQAWGEKDAAGHPSAEPALV